MQPRQFEAVSKSRGVKKGRTRLEWKEFVAVSRHEEMHVDH
jgi:hypothetical protein